MNNKNLGWISLFFSGILEIVWAFFLDLSEGFTILLPSILALIFLIPSFFLLEKAIRTFGIGMTYAVFTGIGIVGTTVVGVIFLNESIGFWAVFFLVILLIGIIGLRFCDDGNSSDENRSENSNAEKECER